MKPNLKYATIDELYASRIMRNLEMDTDPRPDLGLLILAAYTLALGGFVWWVVTP
jgi:hypothetical protein